MSRGENIFDGFLPGSVGRRAVAWMHTLNMEFGQKSVRFASAESDQPFGKPGIDFSEEYTVTVTPLYLAIHSSSETPKADADLIAAAHHMLAALKRVLNHPLIRLTGDAEELVRSVIDKAEGR